MSGSISGAVASEVAKVMVKVLSSSEETTRNLTEAEETVRGLTFDLFREKTLCKLLQGIMLEDYESLVNGLAKRLDLPELISAGMLDNKYLAVGHESVIDFKFEKGTPGFFTLGRIATVRTEGNKIDMAYAIYHLDFKISPNVIEHKKKKKFLGFTTGSKVWHTTRERNMSQTEQASMKSYFMKKAIDEFKKEYSGFISPNTTAALTN